MKKQMTFFDKILKHFNKKGWLTGQFVNHNGKRIDKKKGHQKPV